MERAGKHVRVLSVNQGRQLAEGRAGQRAGNILLLNPKDFYCNTSCLVMSWIPGYLCAGGLPERPPVLAQKIPGCHGSQR